MAANPAAPFATRSPFAARLGSLADRGRYEDAYDLIDRALAETSPGPVARRETCDPDHTGNTGAAALAAAGQLPTAPSGGASERAGSSDRIGGAGSTPSTGSAGSTGAAGTADGADAAATAGSAVVRPAEPADGALAARRQLHAHRAMLMVRQRAETVAAAGREPGPAAAGSEDAFDDGLAPDDALGLDDYLDRLQSAERAERAEVRRNAASWQADTALARAALVLRLPDQALFHARRAAAAAPAEPRVRLALAEVLLSARPVPATAEERRRRRQEGRAELDCAAGLGAEAAEVRRIRTAQSWSATLSALLGAIVLADLALDLTGGAALRAVGLAVLVLCAAVLAVRRYGHHRVILRHGSPSRHKPPLPPPTAELR